MNRTIRLAAVCAAVFTLAGAASVSAQEVKDIEIGQSEAAQPEAARVNLGTSPINRMTAGYATNVVTCSSSKKTALLTQTINIKKKGNLSAHFQAEFGSSSNCDMNIFLQMDGKAIPGPGRISQGLGITAHSSLDQKGTHGFVWAVKKVSAGKHKFQVMCLCDSGSGKVSEREVIYYHR